MDSLLGNLGTKVFPSNNDSRTNKWASETIGRAFLNVTSISVGDKSTTGSNQQLHYQVEPRVFTTLKSGGEINDFTVEGVITIAGREWSDEKNYREVPFKQTI